MWGYVSVQRIVDKVHLKQDVPQIIPMEVVRVTKDNLGTWARQLKTWGFKWANSRSAWYYAE